MKEIFAPLGLCLAIIQFMVCANEVSFFTASGARSLHGTFSGIASEEDRQESPLRECTHYEMLLKVQQS